MTKTITLYVILCLFLPIEFFSKESGTPSIKIEAEGSGTSKEEALDKALRNAVRQAIGSYIDNRTVADNKKLIEDEILFHTKGYVKSFKKLLEQESGGIWTVRITAEVINEKVTGFLQNKNLWNPGDETTRVYAEAQTKYDRKASTLEILDAFLKDTFPQKAYRFEVDFSKSDPRLDRSIRSELRYQISFDLFFLTNFKKTLKQITVTDKKAQTIDFYFGNKKESFKIDPEVFEEINRRFFRSEQYSAILEIWLGQSQKIYQAGVDLDRVIEKRGSSKFNLLGLAKTKKGLAVLQDLKYVDAAQLQIADYKDLLTNTINPSYIIRNVSNERNYSLEVSKGVIEKVKTKRKGKKISPLLIVAGIAVLGAVGYFAFASKKKSSANGNTNPTTTSDYKLYRSLTCVNPDKTPVKIVGITTDSASSIYIIQSDAPLLKMNSAGQVLQQWQYPKLLNDNKRYQTGLVADRNNYIYIMNSSVGIFKFDSNGNFIEKWELKDYYDFDGNRNLIATDLSGNVYCATRDGNIYKYSSGAQLLNNWKAKEYYVNYLAVDSDNNIYVSSCEFTYPPIYIEKFNSDGILLKSYDNKIGDIEFGSPSWFPPMSCDTGGNLIIACKDKADRKYYLVKVNKDGTVLIKTELAGWSLSINYISVDKNGFVYLTHDNNLISIYKN